MDFAFLWNFHLHFYGFSFATFCIFILQQTLYNGGLVLLFISLQVLIMLIMIGVSVYKPWKKKSAIKQQISWLTDKPPEKLGMIHLIV